MRWPAWLRLLFKAPPPAPPRPKVDDRTPVPAVYVFCPGCGSVLQPYQGGVLPCGCPGGMR